MKVRSIKFGNEQSIDLLKDCDLSKLKKVQIKHELDRGSLGLLILELQGKLSLLSIPPKQTVLQKIEEFCKIQIYDQIDNISLEEECTDIIFEGEENSFTTITYLREKPKFGL